MLRGGDWADVIEQICAANDIDGNREAVESTVDLLEVLDQRRRGTEEAVGF